MSLDSRGCRRLVAAVVISALREVARGDQAAERWLYSDQAALYLDELDLIPDYLPETIEAIKAGRRPLSISGKCYHSKNGNQAE